MSKISENLKSLRIASNLSQKDLAKLLNVRFKTISHWESGYSEPSLDMLKALKNVLQVTYDDLLE